MILITYDKKPSITEISSFFGGYDGIESEGDNWILIRDLDNDNLSYHYSDEFFSYISEGYVI